MKIVQTWSGGKDSSLAAYKHLQAGHDTTLITAIPYFDETIPLIDNEQLDFIYEKKRMFENMGAKVHILRGMSYVDYCLYTITRGVNVGKVRGYPVPIIGKCGFMRDGKKYPIDRFIKSMEFDKRDIAYTIDENRDVENKNYSYLRELGYTQRQVYNECRSLDLLSPVYLNNKRDGCLLCYNASCKERYRFFELYPSAFDKVYDLQRLIKDSRPDIYPLRDKHYFIEDENFISPKGSNVSIFKQTIN